MSSGHKINNALQQQLLKYDISSMSSRLRICLFESLEVMSTSNRHNLNAKIMAGYECEITLQNSEFTKE